MVYLDMDPNSASLSTALESWRQAVSHLSARGSVVTSPDNRDHSDVGISASGSRRRRQVGLGRQVGAKFALFAAVQMNWFQGYDWGGGAHQPRRFLA